jgi:hypothetical protein
MTVAIFRDTFASLSRLKGITFDCFYPIQFSKNRPAKGRQDCQTLFSMSSEILPISSSPSTRSRWKNFARSRAASLVGKDPNCRGRPAEGRRKIRAPFPLVNDFFYSAAPESHATNSITSERRSLFPIHHTIRLRLICTKTIADPFRRTLPHVGKDRCSRYRDAPQPLTTDSYSRARPPRNLSLLEWLRNSQEVC